MKASARVTPPFDRDDLRAIILRTAAASGLRDGQVRYYASAGPGGRGRSINHTRVIFAQLR